jgi:hypothetical protein
MATWKPIQLKPSKQEVRWILNTDITRTNKLYCQKFWISVGEICIPSSKWLSAYNMRKDEFFLCAQVGSPHRSEYNSRIFALFKAPNFVSTHTHRQSFVIQYNRQIYFLKFPLEIYGYELRREYFKTKR